VVWLGEEGQNISNGLASSAGVKPLHFSQVIFALKAQ
jgi:hypothetical protein